LTNSIKSVIVPTHSSETEDVTSLLLSFDEKILLSTQRARGNQVQVLKLDFENPNKNKIIQLAGTSVDWVGDIA